MEINKDISTDSVFIKRSEIKSKPNKLNFQDIIKTIPENSFNEPQEELKKTKVESRWRILEINDKKYVEISFLDLNNKRTFVDKYGDFVESVVDDKYNKYVVASYYYYSDS